MKKIRFARGQWADSSLVHVYSYRFDDRPVFVQEDDCIRNSPKIANPAGPDDYDYITLLTKEKYEAGVTIGAEFSFEDLGAPLLVLTDEIIEDHGERRYGNYYEVVMYKDGINVWKLWMQEDRKVVWHKLMGVKFPVTQGERHTLRAKINRDTIEITADERSMMLRVADLPARFHVGLSGCEGMNRFYEMTIDQ